MTKNRNTDEQDDQDEQDAIAERIRTELIGLYEAERDERIAEAELRLAKAQAECTREKHAAHEEYRRRVEAIHDARRRERAS